MARQESIPPITIQIVRHVREYGTISLADYGLEDHVKMRINGTAHRKRKCLSAEGYFVLNENDVPTFQCAGCPMNWRL